MTPPVSALPSRKLPALGLELFAGAFSVTRDTPFKPPELQILVRRMPSCYSWRLLPRNSGVAVLLALWRAPGERGVTGGRGGRGVTGGCWIGCW